MNISYFDFAGKPFEATLVYKVDQKSEIDRDAWKMIKEQERIFARTDIEGTEVNFEITDKMSLKKYLTQKLSKGEVLGLLKNIAQAAAYVSEAGLKTENLLLDVDLVLVDQESGNASLIYLPVEEHDLRIKSLRAFLKEIIVNIIYDGNEDLDYVGRLIAGINTNKDLSGSELLGLIEELRNRAAVREEPKTAAAADPLEEAGELADDEAAQIIAAEKDVIPVPYLIRDKTGDKIYIEKDEFKIGKSRIHADYALENNSAISRVHVIIIRRNGVNYLKDNASTNGTFVDGEKLEPGREVLLKNNMHVKFGDEDFIFYLREEAN